MSDHVRHRYDTNMAHTESRGEVGSRRSSGVPGRSLSLVPTLTSFNSSGVAKKDNRIIINVGGVRYETYKSTLKNIPDTRLSWLTQTTVQNCDFDPTTGEYFFDRHPAMFNMVLNYYRTGKLHAPIDVCGPLFEEELAFWGIDEKQIEPCCWMTYRTHRDAQETLKELDGEESDCEDSDYEENVAERFGIKEDDAPDKSFWETWQPKMWSLLDDPYSTKAAEVLAIISLMFILLSITTFCLGTHPEFRKPHDGQGPINDTWTTTEIKTLSSPIQWLEILDFIPIGFFTLEFVARLTFCPHIVPFVKKPLSWVDFFSFFPFYIEKIIIWLRPDLQFNLGMQLLQAFRLIRVFRIFKLTRHFSGLKILAHTIRASAMELLLLIMFLLITVLISACLIYYAETVDEHEKNYFKNIPIGFWWAVVTMTTLGYGDMYPRTGLGYVVGSLCAVAGVLVLALPVPVIVSNFALYYSHAQAKLKLPKKKKKILVNAPDMLKTQMALPGLDSPLQERRSTSLESQSGNSDQKESLDSVNESVDSGVKSESNGISESCGISVIFTDELGDSLLLSPKLKSPTIWRANGNVVGRGEGGVGRRSSGAGRRKTSKFQANGRAASLPLLEDGVNPSSRPDIFYQGDEVYKRNSLRTIVGNKPPPRRRSLRPQMTDIDV